MAGDEGREDEGFVAPGAPAEEPAVPRAEPDRSSLPPPPFLPPPPGPPVAAKPGMDRRTTRLVVGLVVGVHVLGSLFSVAWLAFVFLNGPGFPAPVDQACDQVDAAIGERGEPPAPPAVAAVDPEVALALPDMWFGARDRPATPVAMALDFPDPEGARRQIEAAKLVDAAEVEWQGRGDDELVVIRSTYAQPSGAAAFDRYTLLATCSRFGEAHQLDGDPWFVMRDTGNGTGEQRVTVSWVVGTERWSVSAVGDEDRVSQDLVLEVVAEVRAAQQG